jgi:hypothetical protein
MINGACVLSMKEAELINVNRQTTKCHMSLPQISKFFPINFSIINGAVVPTFDKAVLVTSNAFLGFPKRCVLQYIIKHKFCSRCFAESYVLAFAYCSFQ